MARVLVGMGITKVRLTGGEPLLRKGVVEFVRELAKLRPQGLKPASFSGANGTAKAVPFHNGTVEAVLFHESSTSEDSATASRWILRSPPTATCWPNWRSH